MLRALLLRSGHADAPVRRLYSDAGLRWLRSVTLSPDAQASATRLRRLLDAPRDDATAAEADLTVRAAADPIAGALDALGGPIKAFQSRFHVRN